MSQAHQKEKAKREYKFKEERTELQRTLGILEKNTNITNILLIIIAMTLFGIFIRLVLG